MYYFISRLADKYPNGALMALTVSQSPITLEGILATITATTMANNT